jgi:hypothetical protein
VVVVVVVVVAVAAEAAAAAAAAALVKACGRVSVFLTLVPHQGELCYAMATLYPRERDPSVH